MTLQTMIAVGGFASEVGKTTLMCDLLERDLRGWEAIKFTRGHDRSCVKDAHACCVGHLLRDEPSVRSGYRETYAADKDTGRYWEAGAGGVHWVIATDDQVERGLALALERVKGKGVLVEGNSFLKYIAPAYVVMVTRASGAKIKPSARRALAVTSALYLSDHETAESALDVRARFAAWSETTPERETLAALPRYTRDELPQLIAEMKRVCNF